MVQIDHWLCTHNLPESRVQDEVRLKGEALTYALTMFLRRPGSLPNEVVVLLATGCFANQTALAEA